MAKMSFGCYNQNQLKSMSEYFFFSDECIFPLNAWVDIQNVRFLGMGRLTEGKHAFSHSLSTILWSAILKEKVVGPYFFIEGPRMVKTTETLLIFVLL